MESALWSPRTTQSRLRATILGWSAATPHLLVLTSHWVGTSIRVAVVPAPLVAPLGGALILVAIVLFTLSVREFRAAGTAIRTHRPTTVIIKTGPYRLSRNPIYLSFTLLHVGIGVWINSAWLLGILIPTLLLISHGVVAREERYLARKFGDEYLRYKASVRRWL